MRATGDMDRANMELSTFKCTMPIAAGKEETAEDSVQIPILQNIKPLKQGDELIVFREALVQAAVSIDPTPSTNKRPLGPTAKRLGQPKKKAMKSR